MRFCYTLLDRRKFGLAIGIGIGISLRDWQYFVRSA
jgi:hypothetical protein